MKRSFVAAVVTWALVVNFSALAWAQGKNEQAAATSGDQVKKKAEKKIKAPKTDGVTPERQDVPAEMKWNTTHLFANDEAWEKERKNFVSSLGALRKMPGTLKKKEAVLACLKTYFEGRKRLAKLMNYTGRKFDENTRISKYQGLKEVADKAANDFAEATAFISPEILSLPEKSLKEMITDRAFADYDMFLKDLLRVKPHVLTSAEETLLARVGLVKDTGYNVYQTFSGSELKFPQIRDEKGKKVELNQAVFSRYRSSEKRAVRKEAMETFFGTYDKYKNTIAGLLSAQINGNIAFAKSRKYPTAIEAALDANNVPVNVYHSMIKAVNKNLPTLHRYLKLRQKLLGLSEMRYYDLYPPIVKKVEMKYTPNEARALLAEALAPMGKDYIQVLSKGMEPASGWVDVLPNQGKRSGAYMDGSAYDIHPYVLLNFLGEYDDVSTYAHEMGHALHSYLSNKNQPYAKSDYSIFVAEVASTLNESLLMEHMLKTVKTDQQRLFLLGELLETFRTTIFRQALFAEFELALYQKAEKKEALTAEAISKTYLEIVRRYYGHEQKLVQVDDNVAVEWAFVPHFYYNFYVFQYVTGMVAAKAITEKVLQEGDKARDAYTKNMLKAGSSDYPIELLKRAGADMTSAKPYDVAFQVFTRTIEAAEKIVEKTSKK